MKIGLIEKCHGVIFSKVEEMEVFHRILMALGEQVPQQGTFACLARPSERDNRKVAACFRYDCLYIHLNIYVIHHYANSESDAIIT